MAEIVFAVVGKVSEYLVAPIGRQLGYLFCYRTHTHELRNKVQELREKRDDLKITVNEARRRDDEIRPVVQDWLNRVDQITGEAEALMMKDENNNKISCFNLKSRYHLGREAYKKAQVIVEIQDTRSFPDGVSYRVPPRSATFKEYESYESRASTLNKIMDALRDDKTMVIGVWGMGGVGKTTLLKQVAEQAKQEKLFATQVYIDVSWTRDADKIQQGISDIQQHIADMLGLEFKNEAQPTKAAKLMQRLKNEKILIILDDIWKEINLGQVGIPSCKDDDQKVDCKIVLASRDEYILRKDMGAQDCFPIQHLPLDEAWHLFKMTAGDSVENDLELRAIAKEVVKGCQGLPIAIVTIAMALKDESVAIWKNALDELRSCAPTNIRGVEEKVYTCLELSYNYLKNDEVKSLFLLCGSLSYGDISMDHLLRYAMGLDLFDRISSLEQARNKLVTLVRTLKASSLLLEGEDRRYYYGRGASRLLFMDADDKTVRMHDVVRDVARNIASKHPHHFVVREDDWSETDESKFISLNCKAVHELPERLVCPELKFFLLQSNSPSLNIPNTFFEGMDQLKVLDLSQMRFPKLPSTIQSLANLRTLCLDWCFELRDIVVVGELRKLQVLSMVGSRIQQLPQETAQLTDLRLLNLSDCSKLNVIPRNILSQLSRLECLFMKSSFSQWAAKEVSDGESNIACLSELNHLAHLTMIDVEISDAKLVPEEDKFFENLTSFAITIGYFYGWEETYKRSKTLRLHGGDGSLLLRNGMGKLLEKIEALELRGLEGITCNNEKNDSSRGLFSPSMPMSFHNFKYLSISDCGMQDKGKENVSIPIEDGVLFGEKSFQNLKEVVVRDCKVLERVFDQGLNEDSSILPKIEILKLEEIPKLRYMFCNKDKNDNMRYLLSPFKFKDFHRLKELHIINCGKPLDEKVSFSPNLEVLVLRSFFKLKEINFGISPKLKILKLNKLPKLRRIICDDDKNASERCNEDENIRKSCIFSPSTFKDFSNLKELSFYGCGTEDMRDGDGAVLSNEKVPLILESRASTLNKIMDALRGDEINLIGVVGIGGVGKTTLVKQVAHQAKQQKLFTKQVYIDLSSRIRHSDELHREVISYIQQKIAEKLFWKFEEWYNNESKRAVEMRKNLKKERILIILDDIWKEIDLDEIGIPSSCKDDDDDVKQCKIVLTCRDEPYMGGLNFFRVERLTSKEAWTLFEKTAGADSVVELENNNPEEVRSIAIQVFEECCEGLPLAIVPIAEALKNEPLAEWKDALEQHLRNCLAAGKKAVYSCLEWCYYTHLKRDDLKSLLLLCGSLSYGNISMYHLLQYAVGLDSFDGIDDVSLEQARDRLVELVEILKASGWLLEGHVDGHNFYEERDSSSMLFADAEKKFVRMHDVVYDVVRKIASKDPRPFVVREDAGLEEWSKTDESQRCNIISLDCKPDSFVVREDVELKEWSEADVDLEEGSERSTDVEFEEWLEMCESNRCDFISLLCKAIHDQLPQGLVCPELQFLLLQNSSNNNNPSLNIPDTFFQEMKKLQVLDLPGMCFTTLWSGPSFTKLPSSLDSLANLQTLRLDGCLILDGIAGIGKLKKLKVLSLAGSDIGQLPDEMAQLSNLRLLDLNRCWHLKVIPRNILSSLSRLECLLMRESFSQWAMVEGDQSNANACLSELNHLSSLTTLSIEIPDAQMLSKDIQFDKLTRYAILLGDPNHLWGCGTNRMLKLKKVNRSIKLGDGVGKLFERSKELEFKELSGTKHVLYLSDGKSFAELKHLQVSDSPEIQCIIESTIDQQFLEHGALPLLESLKLMDLENLKEVWHGSIPIGSFGNLKTLEVFLCHRLRYLFSLSTARGLSQLENMAIGKCNTMQQIIAYERELEDEYGGTNLDLFPNLQTFKLLELPELINFSSELETTSSTSSRTNARPEDSFSSHKVSCSKLEKLELKDLPKFKDIWSPQRQFGSFCNLRILENRVIMLEGIDGNEFLSYKPWGLRNLPRLRRVEDKNDSMKDISSPLVHMKTHNPKERGRPTEDVLFCEKVNHWVEWSGIERNGIKC